jgi:hypothetical protein
MATTDNSFPGLLKMNSQTYEMELDQDCTILMERTFSIFLDPSWNKVVSEKEYGDKTGKYRTKGKAVLKFIYLVEDIRSHLYSESPESMKLKKAYEITKLNRWFKDLKEVGKNEAIQSARVAYREYIRKDARIRMMDAMDGMVGRMIDHISTVNFDERKENGEMVYDPIKYTKLMDELPSKINTLHENKKNIFAAFTGKGRALGDREIGMYEE